MSESLPRNAVAERAKRNLGRFFTTGVLAAVLVSVLVGIWSYTEFRSIAIDINTRFLAEQFRITLNSSYDNEVVPEYDRGGIELQQLSRQIELQPSLLGGRIYTEAGVELVEVGSFKQLCEPQFRESIKTFAEPNPPDYLVIHDYPLDLDYWRNLISLAPYSNSVWVKVANHGTARPYIMELCLHLRAAPKEASFQSLKALLYTFGACLGLIFILSFPLRSMLKTVDAQESQLNQQINELSGLLDMNQRMRQQIKTASARAVELNEQFLRRVGADLHDGPAQMIGYSALRINEISRKEAAKEFGQEFHAIKEALEESLEEIRGISSGLVLPELQTMSLEECLRKVVILKTTKTDLKVEEYYTALPLELPIAIKITAYRFVQECLNNSERHGQATVCKLSAQLKDDMLTVVVKDNGMGFRKSKLSTAAKEGHLGIMGLRDRIESLGGKLSIKSDLGIGTALKLLIPLGD